MFFIGIAQKQKTLSEAKVSTTVRSDLKTIFTGARASTGTASLIDLVGKDVEYSCSGYSVGNLNPAQEGISFSPGLIKGFKVTVWSKDWSLPYRISNMLFVTSPNIKYVLVGNSQLAKEMNKSLPPNFLSKGNTKQALLTKEMQTDTNQIVNDGNYRIRLIFFNHDPVGTEGLLNINIMEDSEVSAVNIVGNSLDSYGELRFYQKKSDRWSLPKGTSYYLGRESLYGALFTDDYKSYDCNMRRAFKRMAFVSEIYIKRAAMLQQAYQQSADTACATQLSLALDSLNTLKTNANTLAESFPAQQPIAALFQASSSLKTRNEQLQRLSCSEVY